MSTPNSPAAGWYPDAQVPGGERYWDGQRWTDARRDGQDRVPPPPVPSATVPLKNGWSSRIGRVAIVIIGILIAGAVAAAISSAFDSGVSGSDDNGSSDASSVDCDDLASQAVDISKGKDVELLKVRNPVVKVDNRDTYSEPTGSGESLILSCTGEGVWSDDQPSPVLLRYTIDSDGDTFVGYAAQ